MTYRCIPYIAGVAVSINSKSYFTFNNATHSIVDIGGGKVTIKRKIDTFIELIGEPISEFVDTDGFPVAATYEQLNAYMTAERADTSVSAMIEALSTKNDALDSRLTEVGAKMNANIVAVSDISTRVDIVETKTSGLTSRLTNIESVSSTQESMVQEAKSINTTQDARLTTLETSNVSHTSKLAALEAKSPLKADLVSGKIPMSQLPDLPVGRKVSVSDDAERLGLEKHPDLTIAYQLDTADAWVLDANEDPSIAGNWDKLGNAQGTGVSSFKGRTGNVTPAPGDYTADQITPTSDLTFVSKNDRTRWDAKATNETVIATVSTLRSESKLAYLTKDQKGSANGLASLGADGVVPAAQLPPQGMTSTQAQRLTTVESSVILANQKGDSAASNILAVDNRIAQVDRDRTADITGIKADYIKNSSKGVAGGVASLGADGKVLAGQIPTMAIPADVLRTTNKGTANGVAPLDSTSRVPIINLPSHLPQKGRKWVNVKAVRSYNVWRVNDSGNDMQVFIRAAGTSEAGRYIICSMRELQTSTAMQFDSSSIPGAGTRYMTHEFTVPAGWQYAIAVGGGSTGMSQIGTWYELS